MCGSRCHNKYNFNSQNVQMLPKMSHFVKSNHSTSPCWIRIVSVKRIQMLNNIFLFRYMKQKQHFSNLRHDKLTNIQI